MVGDSLTKWCSELYKDMALLDELLFPGYDMYLLDEPSNTRVDAVRNDRMAAASFHDRFEFAVRGDRAGVEVRLASLAPQDIGRRAPLEVQLAQSNGWLQHINEIKTAFREDVVVDELRSIYKIARFLGQ